MTPKATLPAVASPAAAYARFARRLRAVLIDTILFALVFYIGLLLIGSFEMTDAQRRASLLLIALGILAYEPALVWLFGGTIGHRLSNLRVVDDASGGNPTLFKAACRALIKDLLGWLSFVSMAITRRHQAIHDVLTRSTVQIRDLSQAAVHHDLPERTTAGVERVQADRANTPAGGPYQPPTARVSDAPEPVVPRPRRVTIACSLLWVSLALGLTPLVLPSHEPFEDTAAKVVFTVTVALATLLSAALIFFAGRRRNWARWGLLILVALSWIEGLFAAQGFREDAFPTIVNAVSTLLDTLSVWLLFSGPAARWFRRQLPV